MPVLGDDANEGARGAKFNDVEWVRLAVETLRREGALSDEGLTWEDILKGSLNYMRRKEAEGRFEVGWKGGSVDAVPTFDLLTDKDVLF